MDEAQRAGWGRRTRLTGLTQGGGARTPSVKPTTWDRQTTAITKYVKHHGLEVVHEFRDAGASGTKDLDNRPGLAALLDRVESNGVKIVLVENATRLARDLMVGEVILQQLTSAGCKVIATDSGTDLSADSDDPTRRLIRQVLGAVAEFDRRVTVMKLRAARERRRARGERCEGRKPFGTLPGEAETLTRIRELRRKPPHGRRRSLQQICDALNAEGLSTRTGKPWTKGVVNRILGRG
jgi:DNA invertase Pin-like site-specific DNA recombinase